MPRETKFTAIILKKQPYLEGDEIITLFTKEQGKLRALAKSVKLSKSKLQQKLQALFLVEITLSQGELPKIIGVEVLEVFAGIRQNLDVSKTAFYVLETVMKFTADGIKNEPLFLLVSNFLKFLADNKQAAVINSGLIKFKAGILEVSGLELQYPKNLEPEKKIFFSPSKGGFSEKKYGDSQPLAEDAFLGFLRIAGQPFEGLPALGEIKSSANLQAVLSQFIEYHLERKIKSEKFLNQ